MFVDTRSQDEGSRFHAEVCIIGGGVAGITLALEFERHGIETCLLESGGFEPDEATRDLYRGESVAEEAPACEASWSSGLRAAEACRRIHEPTSPWPVAI
jgi:2-polyprenyl-6-methoxyphenol hydroxylase-like FAD-dependent oxidoreductase